MLNRPALVISRWSRAVTRSGAGDEMEAYRDRGDRPFHEGDLEFLASVGSSLGAALRRGLGAAPPVTGDASELESTGVIVLNADLQVVSVTAGARAWIGAFPLVRWPRTFTGSVMLL